MAEPDQYEDQYSSALDNTLYFISSHAKRLIMVTVLGFVALSAAVYMGSFWLHDDYKKQQSIQHLQDLSTQLLSHSLQMRRYEEEFINTKNPELVSKFQAQGNAALQDLSEMQMALASEAVSSSLTTMKKKMQKHVQNFNFLVSHFEEFGLTEDKGMRGKMRQVAHKIEAMLYENKLSDLMQVFLMVRRFEKDFLLRKKKQYVVQVTEGLSQLQSMLKTAKVDDATASQLQRLTEQYSERFNALAGKAFKLQVQVSQMDLMYEELSVILGQVNDYIGLLIEHSRTSMVSTLSQFKNILTAAIAFLLFFVAYFGIALMRRVSQLTG